MGLKEEQGLFSLIFRGVRGWGAIAPVRLRSGLSIGFAKIARREQDLIRKTGMEW